MSLEDLRSRIERLNRGPLPAGDSASPAGTDSDKQPAETSAPRRFGPALEQVINGVEIEAGSRRCFRIERRLSECWTGDREIGRRFADVIGRASSQADRLDPGIAGPVTAGADSMVFLDLETCGFAGTPVFLIGTLRPVDGDLHVEQLLARTYEEEPAILARLADLCATRSTLVSFNGKSFDWPFCRDRAAVCRVELPEPAQHCDLLHVCRRHYGRRLPDCKLQTLERYVCNRRRVGDIPGQEIPGAYHDFVRTGDAGALRDIIHHNFLDLVTTADLLAGLVAEGGAA